MNLGSNATPSSPHSELVNTSGTVANGVATAVPFLMIQMSPSLLGRNRRFVPSGAHAIAVTSDPKNPVSIGVSVKLGSRISALAAAAQTRHDNTTRPRMVGMISGLGGRSVALDRLYGLGMIDTTY